MAGPNNGWKKELKEKLVEAREMLKDAEDAALLLDEIDELTEADRLKIEKQRTRVDALLKAVDGL